MAISLRIYEDHNSEVTYEADQIIGAQLVFEAFDFHHSQEEEAQIADQEMPVEVFIN